MTQISLTSAPVPAPSAGRARGTGGVSQTQTGGGFAAVLADGEAASASAFTGGSRLSVSAMNRKSEAETRAAIHKAAGDFEATCLGQLMTFMTQQVDVDANFGGGHGEEMFREMLNTEYGKLAHTSGSAGIAGPVEREMLRAQGLKPLASPSLSLRG